MDPWQRISFRGDLTIVRKWSRFEISILEVELTISDSDSVFWLMFSREVIPKDVMHKNHLRTSKTHMY